MKVSRPRLLCLIHRVPYPPNRGDRIRSFHLVKFLADRAEVHLAFPSEGRPEPETIKALERYCQRVAAVPVGRRMRWVSAAWSLAVGRTATEGLFRSARLKRIVSAGARENHFDAVVVVCSSMVQYLDASGLDGLPVIVDLVDVDSEKWFQYAQHSWGLKRRIFQLEGRRLRRLEASLPDRVEAVAFVSSHEAELFRSFCPTDRVHVIGNGVDLDYFRPDAAAGTSTSPDCVFIGALDYQANLEGVTWFCREIWPEIRRGHPQAVFRLVGSNPGRAAQRLARVAGVDLVGQVPDVRPHLRAAGIAVVPLRVARGVQNKVLEAMAMGKPVVATPQALEGVGATPGVHLCQAVTPRQWVQTIGDLLSDPDLAHRLGCAAREFIQRGFQWNARLQPLVTLPGLDRCLQEATPRARQQVVV